MSDILAGQTEHSSHAPLTQAQTVAICHHLQQQIRSLEKSLVELQREVHHTNEYVTTLKNRSTNSGDDIHDLQVSVAATNAGVEKLTSEQLRMGATISELQASEQILRDRIMLMDEAKKISDNTQDMLIREVKAEKDLHSKFAAAVDKIAKQDIKRIEKEFEGSKLFLSQVAAEQALIAEFGNENREAAREVKREVENVINEVKKTNTVTSILESRLVGTREGMLQNNGKFAALNDQLSRITECYEQTKARVGETEIKIKTVSDSIKCNQHGDEDRQRELEAIIDKVKALQINVEKESGQGDEFRTQINGVRGSVSQLMRKFSEMSDELKECSSSTREVRANLKEQSAMLLPNIHMDSPGAGADFGSPSRASTASSSARRPGGSASPSKAWPW